MATAEQDTVRQTVRERREALGMSQRALSKAAKISRPTLVQMEQDERRADDITSIKTSQTSRRKVVAALDREEQEREELRRRLLDEAMSTGKRITRDVTARVKTGEMSETAALIASADAVNAYAVQLAKLDPEAAEEAAAYIKHVVDSVRDAQRRKAEEN
jgi:DNA-binding XRE family transcriptional regulator